jgi:hypothetical protein
MSMSDSKYYAKYAERGAVKKPHVSRVTVPEHAHPIARLIFTLVRRQNMTLVELSEKAGVLQSTVKATRHRNIPTLSTAHCLINALDHEICIVPRASSMPPDLRIDLEPIAERYGETFEHLAAYVVAMRVVAESATLASRPLCGDERQRLAAYGAVAGRRARLNAARRASSSHNLERTPK